MICTQNVANFWVHIIITAASAFDIDNNQAYVYNGIG